MHVVALVPWDKYREIAGLTSIVVHKTPGNAYEHVTLNERQFPPFADVRVRRALILALDRELFTKTILDGLAPVAHGPIQPVSWAYTDRITRYPFDPARARALLDEAGWKAGPERHPAARRPAAGVHADHAGRLRHPREHRAGDRAPAARRRRRRAASSCTTAPRSARSGSRGGSTRCCTGGRCRRTPS